MTRPSSADDRCAKSSLPAPEEWLERYGDALYRFALARLRRSHEAEEAVQDTLLAALRTRDQFQGRSDPRTWLIGILIGATALPEAIPSLLGVPENGT